MARNSNQAAQDQVMMERAVREARKGAGFVKTNPMVGAVIAIGDNIIATGYHARFGGPHAERRVLQRAMKLASTKDLRKATLYCTLEPCSHVGKTQACLPLVEQSGIGRVVIGSKDPNPQERGRSIAAMKRNGVQVEVGVQNAATDYLIRAFTKWITTHRPYVIGKVGMSMDGKITHPLQQRYITNPLARQRVHELRQEMDAILVGVNTILRDNPLLNTRLDRKRVSNPIKVIMDSRLRTPLRSKVLDDHTIIVCGNDVDHNRKKQLARTGADIIELETIEEKGQQLFERLNVTALLKELGRRNITSVLVEGGSYVFTSFINKQEIDEFQLFMAPFIYGATRLPFTYALEYTVSLESPRFEQLGNNLLVHGNARYN